MKIYNKKGLIAGVLWTAAGAFCLYQDAVDAHDFLPQQIKSVVLSLVMLAVGLTCLLRALSKSASREETLYWLVGAGARVEVERTRGAWSLIRAVCTDGHTRRAWMMDRYLRR